MGQQTWHLPAWGGGQVPTHPLGPKEEEGVKWQEGSRGGQSLAGVGVGRYERATRGAGTHLIERACDGEGQDYDDINNYENNTIPYFDKRALIKMVAAVRCRN
jgi:hypothetical protein